MEIKVLKNLMEANENKAEEVKNIIKEKNIRMLNFISSPGSGKTSLLEKTLERLAGSYTSAVIEGDITTDKDAVRLQKYNTQIVLINTQGGCHLTSNEIFRSFKELDMTGLDYIFIENVGNLVCPSEFNLGEDCKVALISVTEGDDKPAKYPMLFREAEMVILNKIDLLEYVNFDKDRFYEELYQIKEGVPVIEMSITKGTGLDEWMEWLIVQRDRNA